MALTDKFVKVGTPGTATTLQAPGKALGATSINVGATTNWPSTAVFAIRTVDTSLISTSNPSGTVPGTYTEWIGTVSGTTITINATPLYGNDQIYAAGAATQVFIPVSGPREDRLIDGLLVQHKQDGTHANTITTDTINENTAANGVTVDGLNIKDGSIQSLALNNVPVISNPYKFSVYRNAAQSVNASTTAKVNFDTESFDTNNNFDAVTNNRYVAPVAGFYLFSATVTATVDGASFYGTYLYKNGVVHKIGSVIVTGTGTAVQAFPVSALIQLAATDYVEVFWANGSGGSKSLAVGASQVYFDGFLVSRT